MPNQTLAVEQLRITDTQGLIDLSASIGWDYDERDIQTIMSSGTVWGHRNEQGDIISSAAILTYKPGLSTIGMVIVDQRYRGMGLGKTVVQACMDAVDNSDTIMLIATEEGRPLYESMGYHTVSYVNKLVCSSYNSILSNQSDSVSEMHTMPLGLEHFPEIRELDQLAIGADRETFLSARWKQAKQGVVVLDNEGTLIGYGFAVQGPKYLVLGPVVAVQQEAASAMIHYLAGDNRGKLLRIDVPEEQPEFIELLRQAGFERETHPPVMIKNAQQLPARNHTLYGIAAQIFG
ncbi:acetyltransferase, GNAT family protein [Paenibacillus alvei TS-15]|uniref:Acetyltransferase, GNAT family protein n=1 Tax=Paenibacillus alvei TS-15 TaxID=1117108 RepID=S9U3I4_PAEAL|nr:GNAT family N-acetyltransferase [Paenibacillus alvei]EPY09086.1 acetyltransferase, GNAT family protein [Paenibacillus alvei TS-15]